MIQIKTSAELEIIKQNALLVTATLTEVANFLKPGVTTLQMDELAEQFIRDNGGVPSFKGYGPKSAPFPYSLCISVNDEVVHGFPGERIIKDGDIISVDCGVYKNGFHGDHAYTFAVGDVAQETLKLLAVTKKSLMLGIAQAKANNRVGDISFAIEHYTNKVHGYGVVRELVGHGVGKHLHEDPQVPNYGRRGDGKRLREGMVLAIEPMITQGKRHIYTDVDGWTIRTEDGLPAAHFEHTVAIGKDHGIALSDFGPIENAERKNNNLNSGHLEIDLN